jgi:hypothetical protein
MPKQLDRLIVQQMAVRDLQRDTDPLDRVSSLKNDREAAFAQPFFNHVFAETLPRFEHQKPIRARSYNERLVPAITAWETFANVVLYPVYTRPQL